MLRVDMKNEAFDDVLFIYLFITENLLRCHTQIGKGGPCIVNFTAPSPMKLPMFAASCWMVTSLFLRRITRNLTQESASISKPLFWMCWMCWLCWLWLKVPGRTPESGRTPSDPRRATKGTVCQAGEAVVCAAAVTGW